MGLRGPAPKPTNIRILEGNRSKRALAENEPDYTPGAPAQPAGMSPAAKKLWNALVKEMLASGVLRKVDGAALAQLCEDQALLDELREGMKQYAAQIAARAKETGSLLPGNAMVAMSRTIEGRRTLHTIRELSNSIIIQRREFGLTPASNSRVEANYGAAGIVDPMEAAVGGRPDEIVQ